MCRRSISHRELARNICTMKKPSHLLPLLLAAAAAAHLILPAIAEQQQTIARPGCEDKCGNISIPFPFGMANTGSGCFLPGFEVVCNYSSHPPRAFLAYHNENGPFQRTSGLTHTSTAGGTSSSNHYSLVELKDISVANNEARVYSGVNSDCSTDATNFIAKFHFTVLGDEGPFLLSATRNVLIGVGSNVESVMTTYFGELGNGTEAYMPSCLSNLMGNLEYAADGTCSGLGCCQATLPLEAPPLTTFSISFSPRPNYMWETNPCFYGMVVEESWYNFSTHDLDGREALYPSGVPVVLDFAIRNRGSCPAEGQQPPPGYACVSGNSTCNNTARGAYVCNCLEHYHGNPYITGGGGCTDIDECMFPDSYKCSLGGICSNRLEGYDCPCKPGMKGDGKIGDCVEIFPLAAKVIVGFAALIVALVLMVLARQLTKLKRFYEQNGGPALKRIKNIKIYRSKEMKKITNNYKCIIGKGQFGKVYMGTLENKQPVAIKRSIKVDKEMKAEFTDEVILQSGMRHKNIARLIGCCLELDVPMLMYEYASRGSLYDVLFGLKRMDVIPVDIRLGIAAGSAEGLTYMHSSGESTIRHGDVKSANILLDEKFCPKVSDFGTSQLLAGGKAERTEHVVGDKKYIDPIYMEEGLVTQKSDVYSFGIVLIELITRRPATYCDKRSYVVNFVEACLNKRARNFIDNDITSEADIQLLEMVCGVAVECVKVAPEERLEMKQVEHRLLGIVGKVVQHEQGKSYQADTNPAPDDIAFLKAWEE